MKLNLTYNKYVIHNYDIISNKEAITLFNIYR